MLAKVKNADRQDWYIFLFISAPFQHFFQLSSGKQVGTSLQKYLNVIALMALLEGNPMRKKKERRNFENWLSTVGAVFFSIVMFKK